VRHRVVGVLRQWTVAGFAGHMGVFAGGPAFGLVIVTEHAGVLPREGYRVLANQVERPRPVVPILPKSSGDDGAADDEKDCQSGDQHQGRPQEMSRIAEQTAQTLPPFQDGH